MKQKDKRKCYFGIYRYCSFKRRPKITSKRCKHCLLYAISAELFLIKEILKKEHKIEESENDE